MALITMVVHCTKENGRWEYAKEAIACLAKNVNEYNAPEHDVHFVLNGCDDAVEKAIYIEEHPFPNVKVLRSDVNIGTARAINNSWVFRKPGQHAIKIDDDMIVDKVNWPNYMEESAERMKRLHIDGKKQVAGVLGLKRKDCGESTYRTDWGKGVLFEVPHQPGERWMIVEYCHHIMGSCCLYSTELLDKVGFMYQGKQLYGYDDTLMCSRSRAENLVNCFLHGVDVDHIDPGDTAVAEKKRNSASGEAAQWCVEQQRKYESGLISTYHSPYDE